MAARFAWDPRHLYGVAAQYGMSLAERWALLGRRNVGGAGAGKMTGRGHHGGSSHRRTPGSQLSARAKNRRDDPLETISILSGRTHGTGQSNAKGIGKSLYKAIRQGRRRRELTLDRICVAAASAEIPIAAARWKHGDGLITIATFEPFKKSRAKDTRAVVLHRAETYGEPSADVVWDTALAQLPHGEELSGDDAVKWAYHNIVDRKGVGCVWQRRPQRPERS